MFEIAKNTITKNFNGCIGIINMVNYHKSLLIATGFTARSPRVFANSFQLKLIPVYSSPKATVVLRPSCCSRSCIASTEKSQILTFTSKCSSMAAQNSKVTPISFTAKLISAVECFVKFLIG